MQDDESHLILTLDDSTQQLRRSRGRGDLTVTPLQHSLRVRSESATKDPNRNWSNLPMTVKEAARFLGVSTQTVYLWVERKQIPHFRVMGRNIRFLKSDLKPFRAQFRHEVENGKTA